MADTARIPALVNVASGTAAAALEALRANDAFDVHEVQPGEIAARVRELAGKGARRILVAGGDGTIATAAAVLLDTPVELAVLPGGTLNHFARHLGISTVAAEAATLASTGTARGVDVGLVNGNVFLNTSSVGAYVRFVRVREKFEKRLGYRLASAIAAFRILFTLRLMAVEVIVEGRKRTYRVPFVFIGVGERELQLPMLGQQLPGGQRGLHVMVVQGRSRARLLALGLEAMARGVQAASRTPELASFIVEGCRIDVRGMGAVAVDGEIRTMNTPLEYVLKRDVLTVVCPPLDGATGAAA